MSEIDLNLYINYIIFTVEVYQILYRSIKYTTALITLEVKKMADNGIEAQSFEAKKVENDSSYKFEKGEITGDRMSYMENIASEVSKIWAKHDLTILDAKTLMPYLLSAVFTEAYDSDMDVLDYIENYLKPAVFEYIRRIRNSKKFKGIELQTISK